MQLSAASAPALPQGTSSLEVRALGTVTHHMSPSDTQVPLGPSEFQLFLILPHATSILLSLLLALVTSRLAMDFFTRSHDHVETNPWHKSLISLIMIQLP